MTKKPRVAVIGAGIAGLVAAYELSKHGCGVTVFEASSKPGGRMETIKSDGFSFDTGADFLSDNYTTLKSYAKELKVRWEPTHAQSTHRVIRNGAAHPLVLAGPFDVLRLSALSLSARIAFLRWIVQLKFGRQLPSFYHLSALPPAGVDESAHDYLSRVVHPEVAIYIADAFTSIMQFHRATEISPRAVDSLLQMMMRANDRFMIRYTPDGIDAIARALALGLSITYNAPVTQVDSDGHGISVVSAGKNELFDAAVMATTATVALKIIRTPTIGQENLLATAKYASTITVAFTAPASMIPPRLHISYVPYAENKIIGGYTNEGRKPGVVSREQMTLLNIYLHEEAVPALEPKTNNDIAAIVKKELSMVFPEIRGKEEKLKFHAIKRWGDAMPKFTSAHIAAVRDFEEHHQGENSIYFAGDYMNGPWTEGAARSGLRAAAKIIEKFS